MVLQRWYPFREFRRMDEKMDRLWRGFGVGQDVYSRTVPLDVVEEGDEIAVHASVPGVKPENIQVTVEDGVLTIKGEAHGDDEERDGNYLVRERRAGRFHRAIRLPDTVDADKADSRYEHGVVTITFPKVEAKKAKRLEIKTGE